MQVVDEDAAGRWNERHMRLRHGPPRVFDGHESGVRVRRSGNGVAPNENRRLNEDVTAGVERDAQSRRTGPQLSFIDIVLVLKEGHSDDRGCNDRRCVAAGSDGR